MTSLYGVIEEEVDGIMDRMNGRMEDSEGAGAQGLQEFIFEKNLAKGFSECWCCRIAWKHRDKVPKYPNSLACPIFCTLSAWTEGPVIPCLLLALLTLSECLPEDIFKGLWLPKRRVQCGIEIKTGQVSDNWRMCF